MLFSKKRFLFNTFFVYIGFMKKKIMDFLFGKFPQIFNKKGQVSHDLGV